MQHFPTLALLPTSHRANPLDSSHDFDICCTRSYFSCLDLDQCPPCTPLIHFPAPRSLAYGFTGRSAGCSHHSHMSCCYTPPTITSSSCKVRRWRFLTDWGRHRALRFGRRSMKTARRHSHMPCPCHDRYAHSICYMKTASLISTEGLYLSLFGIFQKHTATFPRSRATSARAGGTDSYINSIHARTLDQA